MNYTYEYPKADITADMVVLREARFQSFDVLLIKRGGEPFKGFYALPGGYVHTDTERVFEAAMRELKEETGIKANASMSTFVGFYDKINRDTRGRVITFVWSVIVPSNVGFAAADDAASAEWVPYEDIEYLQLAFDHAEIIKDAFSLQSRKWA